MNAAENSEQSIVVRHFRQIVLWPLQLMPEPGSDTAQALWEGLEQSASEGNEPDAEVAEDAGAPEDAGSNDDNGAASGARA